MKNVAGAKAFLSGYGKSYGQLSAEDRDRLKRWYGITSASDLNLPAKKSPRAKASRKSKATKTSVRHVKAHDIVDSACKSKHLPAFLRKRYC